MNDESMQKGDLWNYFLRNHYRYNSYDGCCQCYACEDMRKDFENWYSQLLEMACKIKGHDFETYAYQTGYYSYDVEMAGHCKRCGFDTHE